MDWDYSDLLDHAPDAFLSVDVATGTVLHCNAAAERLTGYSRAEIVGHQVTRLYDPACRAKARALLERLQDSGELRNEAMRLQRADGTGVDILLNASAVRDAAGTVVASRSVWRDVSDLKSAEAALLDSEQRYRTLFMANPQPMWVYDLDSLRFLEVNDAAVAHYGYSRVEFLEMTIADIRPVADVPRLLDAVQTELPVMAQAGRWRHQTKAGTVIDVEIRSHSLALDGRRARLVQVHDVTERLRAEAAARASDARVRLLVDHAPVALALLDRDMRYLAVSRRWMTDYHLEGRTVLGESHYDVFPDLPDRWREVHQRALAGDVLQSEHEGFERADGTTLWLRWEVRPWRSADDAIAGIVIFTEDITGRRETERALEQSREQLEALSAYIERLREDERTRIAREIHDELGQMLTALKLDLHWVERRVEAIDTSAGASAILDRIVQAGTLVDATVQTVQRIAADLRPGLLDRLGLGAALAYEASRFAARTGIACVAEVPDQEPSVSRDAATALFRIAQEALTNVARHAGASRVTVVLRVDPECIELCVADNGRGFPPEARSGRLGLLGMQERARRLSGHVRFGRGVDGGAEVVATVPRTALEDPL